MKMEPTNQGAGNELLAKLKEHVENLEADNARLSIALLLALDRGSAKGPTMNWTPEANAEVDKLKAHVEACAVAFNLPVQAHIQRVILCDSPEQIAAYTGCPPEQGVVARAVLKWRAICICRPIRNDFYHEAGHVIFQTTDESVADRFMRFCADRE
jgi:hypothetical protein